MNDFKAERRRLKAEIAGKGQIFKQDFASFQEAIKPLKGATSFLSKIFVTQDKKFVK